MNYLYLGGKSFQTTGDELRLLSQEKQKKVVEGMIDHSKLILGEVGG